MYMQMNTRRSTSLLSEKLSIAEARRNLPSLIREAERGKAVELTRRGEPVAVLVGHRMFARLIAGRRGFADAYREFAQRVDLTEVGLDPDVLFDGVRAPTPGRAVEL